ncbi:unnamed protein product [Protopolystoma xenopodis]|uniref:Uncharacterized protein n=1 Tax=Protopolystoma xenopodis TaxID=117903 RepID=A0A3S5B4U9_9PLAT|nr:unnamed protein product [Protopolystoma xenopodis]
MSFFVQPFNDQFTSLAPILARLADILPLVTHHASPHAELASQLRISILTRGAVSDMSAPTCTSVDRLSASYTPSEHILTTREESPRSLIEELSTIHTSVTSDAITRNTNNDTSDTCCSDSTSLPIKLAHLVAQLADPLIPIIGHALIEMARLIEAKDEVLFGHEELLFSVGIYVFCSA